MTSEAVKGGGEAEAAVVDDESEGSGVVVWRIRMEAESHLKSGKR